MKQQNPAYLLAKSLAGILVMAGVLMSISSHAQLTKKEIRRINQFNFLFGDYFTVDENFNLQSNSYSPSEFPAFYRLVEKQWNTEVKVNLDTAGSLLKSRYPTVLQMSLKINEDGVLYPEFLNTHEKQIQVQQYQQTKKVISTQSLKNSQDVNRIQQHAIANYTEEIERLVNLYNIKDIYFFIHGYNVPHSLAQMQGNRIIKLLHDRDPFSPILFIRVFWEAGNKKIINVKCDSINEKTVKLKRIVYRDKIRLRNGFMFFNKLKYGRICGLTFRQVMLSMASHDSTRTRNIRIVTHSMGAVVASSSLVNNANVLQYRRKKFSKYAESLNYNVEKMDSAKLIELAGWRDRTTRDLILLMKAYPLPKLNIHAYLNAPAIPGIKTFKASDFKSKYSYTVGYNYYDPVLAKRFFNRRRAATYWGAAILGNTTLGINYSNEADKTNMMFYTRNCTFNGTCSSDYFAHDFFYYTRHPLFQKSFSNFITTR